MIVILREYVSNEIMSSSRSFRLLENVSVWKIPKLRWKSEVNIKGYVTNAEIAQELRIRNEDVLPFDKIPGPSTLPILGVGHHFLPGGKYKDMDYYQFSEKAYMEYGKIMSLKGFLGKPDLIMSFDFDDMEKIYRTEGIWPIRPGFDTRKHYLKELRPEIFKSVIGLLNSQGSEWQDIRSKVNQPMMHTKVTKQYVGWIEEIANDFISRLRTLLDDQDNVPENFLLEAHKWSLESIARVAMDTRLGCLDSKESSDAMIMITTIERFFQLSYELDWLPSLWKRFSTPKYKELMKCYDTFTELALKYIAPVTKRVNENTTANEENLSVLEKLLKVDPQVALIMAMDMIFAGVDTTAFSAVSALYFLAANPEKQNRLRKEILSIFPRGSPITAEGLNQASYLKACLKETQRIRPVAIGNMRTTGADLVLSGYHVPKGTSVLLHHHLAGKLTNQFPEFDRFIPERWLREDTDGAPSVRSAHKFAYMPFGFGPRMCVGRRFAELEMEVLISRMVSEFQLDWTGAEEMQYKTIMINGPTGPMKFKLTSIK